MKKLIIDAKVEELNKLSDMLEEELSAAGFGMKQIMQLQLAVEEIFVNIASYAYGEDDGQAEIDFDILDDPERAVISFKDSGVKYNPLEKEDPDVTLTAEERGIGGLGIFLTKKTMDSVQYTYEDGYNILTLEKNK